MKSLKKYYILYLIISLLNVSCEDVVEVDLETAEPRLVIDAFIKWEKGTAGNNQLIRLSTTAPFYSESVPPVSGAVVFVASSEGGIFTFTENIETPGNYICDYFVPVLNETYTLTVQYEDDLYMAEETMMSAPEIEYIVQNDEGGFMGDEIEIRFFFQDNGEEDNFYLHTFRNLSNQKSEYAVISDEFFQGNQMFGFYANEDTNPGHEIEISLYGISETYYNYMNILLPISGTGGGNPFTPPSSTIRGNIVNQNDENRYALGFFSVSEVDRATVVVE